MQLNNLAEIQVHCNLLLYKCLGQVLWAICTCFEEANARKKSLEFITKAESAAVDGSSCIGRIRSQEFLKADPMEHLSSISSDSGAIPLYTKVVHLASRCETAALGEFH